MSTSTPPVLAQSIAAHSIVVARQAASVSLVELLATQLRNALATNQPAKLLFLDYDTEGSQEDELTLVTEWPPGNPTERQDIAHAFEYSNGDEVRPGYVNARLAAWSDSDGARC